MKKRAISLILAAMLCLSLGVPALADGETERGVLRYSVAIAPRYEDARSFSEGLAAVKQDGKWGYIDYDGSVVIPFQYELAFSFNEGRAIVAPEFTEDEWGTYYQLGFIDTEGTYTPFMFRDFGYSGYTGPVYSEYYSNIMHNGIYYYNGLAGENYMFGADGWIVSRQGPLYALDGPMNEGLAPAYGAGVVGWVDADGNTVYYFERDYASNVFISRTMPFNQGLAPVWQCTVNYDSDGYVDYYTYKLGFMDRSFQWVIEPQYDNYSYSGANTTYRLFGDTGLAMVQKDGLYGAIDKQGSVVIPFQYEELWPVNDGLMAYKSDGKYGYLDAETLAVVIAPQYEKASGFYNGLAVVYDGEKAFLIDKKGSAVPGADTLDPSTYFKENADGSVTVYQPGSYVVIEENGLYGFGHIEYTKPLPEPGQLDDWAYAEVAAAIEAELVPSYLQSLYRRDITRNDFCDLIMQAVATIGDTSISTLVEERTGRSLSDWRNAYPFVDSVNSDVIAAYALGIVNGRGDGIFDPYATITRQEAAAMLMRAAGVLSMDTAGEAPAGFADSWAFADWAVAAIDYVYAHGIMRGTGDNEFSPLATYTREQSFMTAYRLLLAMLAREG